VSGTPGTSRDFTGQYRDLGTLHFYNARYYDSGLGRFMSPDTIVPVPYDARSYNRFSYVTNNPKKYTDPTGQCIGPIQRICVIGALCQVVVQPLKSAAKSGPASKELKQAVDNAAQETAKRSSR
jgi:RHS repeat-associated protein